MKIYADENFPFRTVVELRRLGHDVLTTLGDERANQAVSDEDVLARAIELERVVLTLNRIGFQKITRTKFKSHWNNYLHRRRRPQRASEKNFRKDF